MTDSPLVSVTPKEPGTYVVELQVGGMCTSHTVEVPDGLASELGWGDGAEEALVKESFLFLLEREPPTSILTRFRLDVIARYFPEYKRQIRR